MSAPIRFTSAIAIGFALVAGGGCGGSSLDAGEGTGIVNIGVTDAAVDSAAKVVVEFSGVELKPQGGSAFTLDINPDRQVDLLTLQGGATAQILQNATVPAGAYEWVRLQVNAQPNTQDDSYIELLTGARFPLQIPSGDERGLQLIRGFNVAVGSVTNFTVDFDLRKSVIAPPGQSPNYVLKPVLRIVDNLEVGTLAGTVSQSLATATGCTPFVYVFTGSNVVPDDLDEAAAPDVDPLVSVPVTLDTASGQWRYRVAFLEAGAYTVSFTCNGAADTPEGEDVLTFTGTGNVTITANQTTTRDF
ncbi:MAG TPA: DUF4382 domain-containing protein [Steroidobacteraceae bacterium]|nr:DUF4382 domain-containing protein [Steroidobacteraceae bacterium]